MTSVRDADLEDVALAVQGDGVAFERLYRRHVGRINALAQWLMGSTDTDEVVQEVFVRVWQKLATFGGQSAFGTWLHRVAINLMLRRRQQRGRDHLRFIAADDLAVAVAGPVDRPELRIALEGAVSQLPAGAREVFVLHDMEGFKHEEIGELLGVDPGTSRSQLHRARMMLRRVLMA